MQRLVCDCSYFNCFTLLRVFNMCLCGGLFTPSFRLFVVFPPRLFLIIITFEGIIKWSYNYCRTFSFFQISSPLSLLQYIYWHNADNLIGVWMLWRVSVQIGWSCTMHCMAIIATRLFVPVWSVLRMVTIDVLFTGCVLFDCVDSLLVSFFERLDCDWDLGWVLGHHVGISAWSYRLIKRAQNFHRRHLKKWIKSQTDGCLIASAT